MGLNLNAFVNTTNPSVAALSVLLTAAAPTVQAAATVAVTVGVAASAAASAVGGAARGGVGPNALMSAQRNYLMSTLAGTPDSCEDPRATSNGGGWTMGRFGFGQSVNPCLDPNFTATTSPTNQTAARRRMNTGSVGAGTGTTSAREDAQGPSFVDFDQEEDLAQRLLVAAFIDTLTSETVQDRTRDRVAWARTPCSCVIPVHVC